MRIDGLSFDPPDPAGAHRAAEQLHEAIDREGLPDRSFDVAEILASEAARRGETWLPAGHAAPVAEDAFHGARRARGAAEARNDELNSFIRIFTPGEGEAMSGNAGSTASPRLLAGIPFAFKDVYFAHGHLPGAGTPYRFPPGSAPTSPLLSRLFAAGAVPVGATNLDPWSYSTTGENPFYGSPVNPNDSRLLVGGSSSGSAVAVAAGIVPFAIGTDTGGSIRIPAALCGVWGWKPTHGLLDTSGVVPLSPSHDCPGVVAQSAAMLWRVADALIDPRSPTRRKSGTNFRIGVARHAFAGCDAETLQALTRVLAAVSRKEEPRSVALPNFDTCNAIAGVVTGQEAVRFMTPIFSEMPRAFTANVRQRLAIGALLSREDYRTAQLVRARLMADFLVDAFGACDAVIAPVVPRASYMRSELDGPTQDVQKLTLDLLSFNRWVNSLALPAMTVPVRTDADAPLAAVQVIGRPFADLDLLRLVLDLDL